LELGWISALSAKGEGSGPTRIAAMESDSLHERMKSQQRS